MHLQKSVNVHLIKISMFHYMYILHKRETNELFLIISMQKYLGGSVLMSTIYFEVHPNCDELIDRQRDRNVIKEV